MNRKIILVFLVGLLTGCATIPHGFFQSDNETTEQAILKKIPIGSDIQQAQSIMENAGFKCYMLTNRQFSSEKKGKQIIHGPMDYLSCDSGEKAFLPYVNKRWQIAIVNKDGLVSELYASVGGTSL